MSLNVMYCNEVKYWLATFKDISHPTHWRKMENMEKKPFEHLIKDYITWYVFIDEEGMIN